MSNKSTMIRLVDGLLVLVLSLALFLQSGSAVAEAATSQSDASSVTADESIDDWMPDKTLQQVVLAALKDSGCSVNTGSRSDLTLSEVKPAMLADLRYLNTGATTVTGITDLTGLQYATGLVQVNFSGSTIEKSPGDWSIFDDVSEYSNLGNIDATSTDADLKDLAKLPTKIPYTLVNGGNMGIINHAENPEPDDKTKGIQITTLKPGVNMTYDSDLSSMKAYIPLSNWYKGIMTTDGNYTYGSVGFENLNLPEGVTFDQPNHRFVVDLNVCGGKKVVIPAFTVGDNVTENGMTANFYLGKNTLDAVVPMSSAPADTSQTVQIDDRTSSTGSINTATFGFGDATSADLTIKSGDLTADDVTFSPDLAENKINFTLTDSGLKKLRSGDLKSVITISAGDKIIDLTLSLKEALAAWLPDTNLQSELQTDLTAQGLGSLTKANLAQLTAADNLTDVSNLTGLEYASKLDSLKITKGDLYGDGGVEKATNSQVLSKLTSLEKIEIDNSTLGDAATDGTISLDGWGLNRSDGETSLTSIIAEGDGLTDPALSVYEDDAALSVLNLSNNSLTGALSQFPVTKWPNLKQLQLTKNQLTGEIPTDWANLTNLSILALSSNQLGGNLDNIAQLPNLTEVYLDNDGFGGSLPSAWFTAKLTHFEANSNQLSGDLPKTLSDATNLKWLDIQKNKLTGALPDLTNDTKLTTLAYGTNHITSGSALPNASGGYQRWSITQPDWQTSSDGKTMTLDLSKYYGGEQGQSGYQYLGYSMPSGETGVTLNKTDPAHPLLTIDTTNTTVTNGKLIVNVFDQAGKQAVFESGSSPANDLNYLATIYDIPVTLSLPKSYDIETNSGDIDFGQHTVGSGMVSTTAKAFSLAVHSENAAGDSYQLTAQTGGLTLAGHALPLYYTTGQHSVLLTNTAQNIYDYQPTSSDDTTVVGDSSDSTKGNLQTDIPATTHTGKYTGDITYTLASAPADDPATTSQASDVGQIAATTLSRMAPTISAASLSVDEEAVRTKLQSNMTSFIGNKLADSSGVLYSGYKASQGTGDNPYQELSETNGLWLLALAESGDETSFDASFNATGNRFYDDKTQTFNWQVTGADHDTSATSNASVDDLRIIQALLVMNAKHPNNDRTLLLNKLIDGFTKHDLNAYYQMIDSYSQTNGQEKRIRLDYLDLSALKAVYEAKGLGTAGDTAYNQQLQLIKDGYISDKLPLFDTYYDYSTGSYQIGDDGANKDSQVNITDGLLTMLNLAKVGQLPQTSLDWLKAHTADRTIYNNYKLDGTPVDDYTAASNYGYVAQIAAAVGDTTLYSQAITALNEMTSTDESDPLYGSNHDDGESYAFNDLNMLLAYNAVFAGE